MSKALAAGLLTALAAVAPSAAQAQNIVSPVSVIAGTRLDVSARGEVKRVPDVAVISAGVVTQAADARTALAQNAERMTGVVAALRRAGIDARDVQTANISLSPQYRYVNNEPPVITGYQASNQVSVRFRDVAKSGAVLDALVAAGANQINGPVLVIDKPEAAEDEARAEAMRVARARAELYARAAGLSVKRIVAISEGGGYAPPQPPIVMMQRMEAADAKTDILPGEQGVGVTLSVTFELG